MTYKFNKVYIEDYYSIIGRNEHKITVEANMKINDYYLNQKSIEQAESFMQMLSIKGLLNKNNLKEEEILLSISSDLQNQLFASNFAMRNFDIPSISIYSACASFCSDLIVASKFLEKGSDKAIVTVSSHNLVSEKQFRFPIEYGSIRKKVNTFTATASISTLISKNKGNIRLESATIGKVVDLGYKDTNNFGACMAPSAAKVIYEHLNDTKRSINYYDVILTGDLGKYGLNILKDYLLNFYNIKANNLVDAGYLLFEDSKNEIAGGSGPACLPLILFDKIISKYKKILIVATGSLHSKTSTNLNESIPSISHAVSLEVIK